MSSGPSGTGMMRMPRTNCSRTKQPQATHCSVFSFSVCAGPNSFDDWLRGGALLLLGGQLDHLSLFAFHGFRGYPGFQDITL